MSLGPADVRNHLERLRRGHAILRDLRLGELRLLSVDEARLQYDRLVRAGQTQSHDRGRARASCDRGARAATPPAHRPAVNGQFEAAWQLHRFLTERRIPYVIVGGIAVQRWGEPRLTIDVDLAIRR